MDTSSNKRIISSNILLMLYSYH